MPSLEISVESTVLEGELLESEAPESVDALRDLLPLESTLLHVRWSGYATWVSLDDDALPELPRENHTAYPSRGDVLLYPGFKNESELLLACGPTCFKSPAGEQAGNHVATLDTSRDTLRSLEATTLEEGGLDVEFRINE
ncbi:DUF3830 family protein [Halorarius halobius]|uniref:DUF3830 family protein n=1 Tax=Halorarius halobius TaxID=2962671 RepID=UPI0020CCD726|nr:DUF3830 family protein [Halorarius halobius]